MRKIDCKVIREKMLDEAKNKINDIKDKYGSTLKLAVIQVGNDPASEVYVRNKAKTCTDLGIECDIIKIQNDPERDSIELISCIVTHICELNLDDTVTGIILQLPLPKELKEYEQFIVDFIYKDKDVDGLTAGHSGDLWLFDTQSNLPIIFPATPSGIMRLFPDDLSEVKVTILGRSNLVGKPLIKLLMDRNATVTCCHSKTGTINIRKSIIESDVVISAIGKPKEIKTRMFDGNKMYIDVGINRDENGKLCGDFDHEGNDTDSAYTSVPGGVGILTTAQIPLNLIKCYERAKLETL